MKTILLSAYLLIMLFSCKSDNMLTNEDKSKILKIIKEVNNIFQPEELNLIQSPVTKDWRRYDQLMTTVDENLRASIVSDKLVLLKTLNVITKSLLDELEYSQSKNESINFAMLLTSHQFGDHLYRVLPLKYEIGKEYCEEVGDGFLPEYTSMTDSEFDDFLKSRITLVKNKKAVFSMPYIETSIPFCEDSDRYYYLVNYYFQKDRDENWFLDNVKIELVE